MENFSGPQPRAEEVALFEALSSLVYMTKAEPVSTIHFPLAVLEKANRALKGFQRTYHIWLQHQDTARRL